MSEKAKSSNTRSPRTVAELAPWLRRQFGVLAELHRQAGSVDADAATNVRELGKPPSRTAIVRELATTAHHVVSLIELLLNQPPIPTKDSHSAGADLARALLLSGSGERFEPAIRSAIRAYVETLDEQFRVKHKWELPVDVREDVLAGFERIATTQRQDLIVLGVTIEPVEAGSPLDLEIHQVCERLATEDSDKLQTVQCAITPLFRWRSGNGQESIEPARVAAFTQNRPKGDLPPQAAVGTPAPKPPPSLSHATASVSQPTDSRTDS